MPQKIALFAFRGEIMCFVHVLLTALDMHQRGVDVKIVIEGTATGQARVLHEQPSAFSTLYQKAKQAGLIDCACFACSKQSDALESIEAQNIPLCKDMSGHPSMADYIEKGYQIITF